ncbi:MraY family glycosyltransferase [Maribacter sp. BPC-D8]|uniref:glycosyltransferase family 4 protein n=1 Tax=Maribacter sp. BPC-D8 TaxID=3053613 RepID=UPI002B49305D|nr:MraY family glycosyltransferase [Maribacter sp. BPC-D8]WRI28349.1 MraY family glycosyltransferase [Maribacter sp. BPC-D8]
MIYDLFSNIYFLAFFSIVFSLLVSMRIYPVIIYLAHKKKLMDDPIERSGHVNKTATLGGIGMFITFSLAIILLGILTKLNQEDLIKLLSILGGIIILLFLGIKDDLLNLSPKKKFVGQIFSAALVVLCTDVRIESFYGMFGVGDLHYVFSVVFSIFIFVFIINAFNLIDGIDGLASSVAIIVNTSFGVYFAMNKEYLFVLVSFSLIGVLLGFLRYNLSRSRKLFMGDSGSLFLGFLLAYQAISFLSVNEMEQTAYTVSNAPIMVLAILAYPILDTVRVFIIRINNGKSPFSADRNHIHHRLLDNGFSHIKSTLIVAICNIFVIQIAFVLSDLYLTVQLYIISVVLPLICLFPFLLVQRNGKIKIEIPKL